MRKNMFGMLEQGTLCVSAWVEVVAVAPPGVVLLEAAAFWPSCRFLGLELDTQQLASRLSHDTNLVVAL